MGRACELIPIGLTKDQCRAARNSLPPGVIYNDFEMYDIFSAFMDNFRDEPAVSSYGLAALFQEDGESKPEDVALPPLHVAAQIRWLAEFWTNRSSLKQEISAALLEEGWWYQDERKIEDPENFEIFRREIAGQLEAMALESEAFAKAGAKGAAILLQY